MFGHRFESGHLHVNYLKGCLKRDKISRNPDNYQDTKYAKSATKTLKIKLCLVVFFVALCEMIHFETAFFIYTIYKYFFE